MTLTVKEIIDILKQGEYFGNLTQIRPGDRNFHLYPSIEVQVPQPLSPTTDPQIITSEEAFEVQIFVRFTRTMQVEYDDLAKNEAEVLRVLGLQPLQEGEFFFQSNVWKRDQTKNVHGVVSTIRVLFRQIVGTEDGTVVGAGSKLQLGSVIALELIGEATADDARRFTDLWNDSAKRFPIPDGAIGARFFEYAWTKEQFSTVQTLIDNGDYIPAKLVDPNGDEEDFTVLPIRQRQQVSFGGLRTVTLQLELVG